VKEQWGAFGDCPAPLAFAWCRLEGRKTDISIKPLQRWRERGSKEGHCVRVCLCLCVRARVRLCVLGKGRAEIRRVLFQGLPQILKEKKRTVLYVLPWCGHVSVFVVAQPDHVCLSLSISLSLSLSISLTGKF